MTKINTKKICSVAMMLAVSVVLGIFSLRIGSGIKISFKFIPVFVCSVLYGPLYGAVCGGLSDFLSYLVNPAGGAYLFPITIVEALYGLSFGLFFYKKQGINTKNVLTVIVCLIVNTVFLSIIVMSYILKDLMSMTFVNTVILRTPSVIINFFFHFIFILVILKSIPRIKKYI